MRSWLGGLVAVVAVVAACSGGGKTIPADAEVDGPGTGVVACGQMTTFRCALPMGCCEEVSAQAFFCYGGDAGTCTPPQELAIACDGPEDCALGACCFIDGVGASCTDPQTCVGNGGAIMCHTADSSPCGSTGTCCYGVGNPLGNPLGAPFASCRAGC